MSEVFLDTAYVVALAIGNDTYHTAAVEWSGKLRASPVRIVTTQGICLEIGNGLSRIPHRSFAAQFLHRLSTDAAVEIVPLSEGLYQRALRLYASRPDKEWGLIDCMSFTTMWDRGITDALTSDHHFQQGGFRALLLQP